MIARLAGTIVERGNQYVVVMTECGIGYRVMVAPDADLWKQLEVGGQTALWTSQHFRETDQVLYGFSTVGERNFFDLLCTVSGVGPKLASTLLAHVERRTLADMIVGDDVASMVRVPGIGAKTAQRIIVELRDKVLGQGGPAQEKQRVARNSEEELLDTALEKLGFSSPERVAMLKQSKALIGTGKTVEDILRSMLAGSAV